MTDLLISSAYAQDAGAAPAGGGIEGLVLMALMFAVLYFLMIRPQQKQQKQHKEMVANLSRGDRVVTTGGLIGVIHRVEESEIQLEVAMVDLGGKDKSPVRVRVRRDMVGGMVAKNVGGASAAEEPAEDKSKEKDTPTVS
ncbi:preprotein translocase subunit YajC [Magnetofaba australis]|uniref:Sec translocon accessory complex subunit YajC n=1 Tax=Magnetofaba australis IT-1 TaxID=1434232 RepID=A0A1Y2K300_9PROT|nr:preprotein translocase subunit YajC [Magnetofaba australis]OSM02047.1 putative protein translocase subunit yajC [Magnetofaba australis IT-1]